MDYNRRNVEYMNYERQQQMYEVGDILQPIERKNAGYYQRTYETLSHSAQYRITEIRMARRGHQLLKLESTTPRTPPKDGSAFSGYDARNFKFISKGDGSVTTTGNVKKTANWIIVDASTGSVVGSIPLTDAPSPPAEDPNAPLLVSDAVNGTANFLNRFGDRLGTETPESFTEKLVNEKISDLLRKNPEGAYMAFKHVKTGKLPVLPVQWVPAV